MAERYQSGKRKEKWPKAKKKKKKNNKAEGLKEKNESTKCLSMPKAQKKKYKVERDKHKVLGKKSDMQHA